MKFFVKALTALALLFAVTACTSGPESVHKKIERGETLTQEDQEIMENYCAEAIKFVQDGNSLSEADKQYPYATEFSVQIVKMKGANAIEGIKNLTDQATESIDDLKKQAEDLIDSL